MIDSYQDMVFHKLYNVDWAETDAIHMYWREFYENPEKYKGTELEKIVLRWVKNGEGKQIVAGLKEDRGF